MIKPLAKEVMINVKMLKNPKKFYKVKECVELSNPHDLLMTIQGCQRPVINNRAVAANNLKDNIAIILQTLQHKCVINVDPAQQDLAMVQEHLEDVLANLREKMKKSYDNVIGLVVGGRAYDSANKIADKGIKLTDAICEFMEIEHIPSTKLLEQNNEFIGKGLDVFSHRENAVLSSGIINDITKNNNAQTEEYLQNIGEHYFDVFEVSPYAPIRFVDEIIPTPSTNLRYR